jgi:hypothetical protein
MNIELPLYEQEKDNTCALACLRMVLAAWGRHVPESELERFAQLEEKGTRIDEVERLARRFGLAAEIQTTTVDELNDILAVGKLPIAFIDRALFHLSPAQRAQHRLHEAKIHTVIPIHLTGKSITFHDPLGPVVTRRTIHIFRQAYEKLGGCSVVCYLPGRLRTGSS